MKFAKLITDMLKYICQLSPVKMLIILAFLSFVTFLTFEYLILDKNNKILPGAFHNNEQIEVKSDTVQ